MLTATEYGLLVRISRGYPKLPKRYTLSDLNRVLHRGLASRGHNGRLYLTGYGKRVLAKRIGVNWYRS
jgi:hypothetical protein